MNNFTKIASLPQGGGCKAALVGEVQSVPAMSEDPRGTFAKISDPANAHLFSAEAMRKAFAAVQTSGKTWSTCFTFYPGRLDDPVKTEKFVN